MIAKTTVMDIDFTKTSKSSFDTIVSVIIKGVPVKLSGDATFEKLKSGELKLVKSIVLQQRYGKMRQIIRRRH